MNRALPFIVGLTMFSSYIFGLSYLAYQHKVVNTLSIQENIQVLDDSYSWDQYCRYTRRDGSIVTKKMASFTQYGKLVDRDQLVVAGLCGTSDIESRQR